MAMAWGNDNFPLWLDANNDLPRASQKNFPKFNGNGKISTNDQIASFFIECDIIFSKNEDVVVRMFVENLVEDPANWFQHIFSRMYYNLGWHEKLIQSVLQEY